MAGPKDIPDSFRISYSPDTDPDRPGCKPVEWHHDKITRVPAPVSEHIELLRRIDKNLALMLDLLRDIAMGFA